VELGTLLGLDLGRFQQAADDWHTIATALDRASGSFQDHVTAPLTSGVHWEGDDADEAAKTCDGVLMDVRAVAEEAGGVQRYLEKMATGDGDGYGNGNLKQAQDDARELVDEAVGKGLRVDGDGTVRREVLRAPGPLSPEEKHEEQEARAECDRIGGEIKKVLKTADALDAQLKDALLLLFGTEETFRTENRDRRDGDPDMGDRFTEGQLVGVEAYMKAQGWDDAAALLDHYLEGSGEPYEVDAGRMLKELPTFQKDVDTSLAGLKKLPDGPVSTGWRPTSSGTEGGDEVMNWYYGLHHFQYRLVGHKSGDRITYQVEVRKRYDWGVPSEHRKDLEAPLHLMDAEQAEIARLNHTGLAQDFDVQGRTTTMTAQEGRG
jgi:hypothetical protein